MARLGRGHPNRPVLSRHPRMWDRRVALPVFESVSEWPAVTVTTPNANVTLPVFESISEWPALTFTYDQSLTLAAFESVSEWPTVTVSIPVLPGDSITSPGQVEWNGTLWGTGTSYRVQQIDGWRGYPGVDNLNVARPSRHGAWDGRKLAQQRIVTIRLRLQADSPELVDDLLAQLDAATGIPDDETPLPLVIRGYGGTHLAYGQIIDKDISMDGDWSVGMPSVALLIACSDPRRYNVDRSGVDVPAGGTVTVTNAGSIATHPIIRIDGPAENPTITNTTMGRALALMLTLAEGERLILDADEGSATVDGSNVISALTGSSVPVADFVLAPGANQITYTNASGAGPATFLYRDAWI